MQVEVMAILSSAIGTALAAAGMLIFELHPRVSGGLFLGVLAAGAAVVIVNDRGEGPGYPPP